MPNRFRFLGSLKMAVPLLLTIGGVLAWGTLYEVRYGTAAVQRFIYHSWWFQGLLGFLAFNLAAAAFDRLPWKHRHTPFLLAHLGIILVLIGGILGSRLGVEGRMIIPEGQTSDTLQLSYNVLTVHEPNPGVLHEFPTRFETTAWRHRPHALFRVPLEHRSLELLVDRYFPDAVRHEEVTDDGETDNPAAHLLLKAGGQEDGLWLFSRDPDRFGARWGEMHLFFLEPETPMQLKQILDEPQGNRSREDRGVVQMEFPDLKLEKQIPVPRRMNQTRNIPGTPYRITFKDYFADFALSDQGPVNRSKDPNNPAVAFVLSGPEGTEVYLLFARHPDFDLLHGRQHKIHAHARYLRGRVDALPPNSLAVVLRDQGKLAAVWADESGQRKKMDPVEVEVDYSSPSAGISFQVAALAARAKRTEYFTHRDNQVRSEAIHVVGRVGEQMGEAWLGLNEPAQLTFEGHPVVVQYGPARRPLDFQVKLLDFRKIDYPGMEMAAGFESDVELSDSARGVSLKRKISMNNPLKYRGFSLYQSSYVAGPTETTILSVRNDPGTPLVYIGFLIIAAGVVWMFAFRRIDP